MLAARHLSVSIARPSAEVYAYASDLARLPEWAADLSGSIRHEDGRWLADSPMGQVEVRMTPPNEHGVLDHEVLLPDGTVSFNPLRVVPNQEGSEVIFTLYRRDGMTDAEVDADADAILRDLTTLKGGLERTR